jgi:glycosyltransferase involved in cell wall biosynthesis
MDDYSITFACLNQSHYTKECIRSLIETNVDLNRVVVVDNGSNDDTREIVSAHPKIHLISNKVNLGCGTAWNQGALRLQTEWTIVMNNDVILGPDWLDGLFYSAKKERLRIVSPAMIEGSDDYDLKSTLRNNAFKARNKIRYGDRHAVCMLIHQSVWLEVGFFRAVPSLFGYEDTLFFDCIDDSRIPTGITGASWIHHYGSVTQSELKKERGLNQREGLSDRKSYKLLGKSWLDRKISKIRRIKQRNFYQRSEVADLGFSLHGSKKNGDEIEWT